MYRLRSSRRSWQKISVLLITVLAIGIAVAGVVMYKRPAASNAPASPVPQSISQAVNFPVYYPTPAKLPAGYTLDTQSFALAPNKAGVAYTVTYSGSKKMVFSVQPKPSDSELQNVNSNFIPLRVDYQTPVGQAEIGAYQGKTFISLPITNGPWIVITAPPEIDQTQLKQVLQAMRH